MRRGLEYTEACLVLVQALLQALAKLSCCTETAVMRMYMCCIVVYRLQSAVCSTQCC
jgi:hypothetical protein